MSVQKTCFIFNLGEESKTKQKIRKHQIGKWHNKGGVKFYIVSMNIEVWYGKYKVKTKDVHTGL